MLLLVLGFTVLGASTAVTRSTIPWHLNGTITEIDVRPEKHPGVDDAWYVSVDGEARRWDATIAKRLEVGDHVAKDRWSTTLSVGQHDVPLSLSRDAKGMTLLGPILFASAVGLVLLRERPTLSRRHRNQRHPRDNGARI